LLALGALGLLFVVAVVAVSLPSLLSQRNKAKQSEARNNIGATGRAQQQIFKEKRSFAFSFSDLGIGIPRETENFRYSVSKVSGSSSVVASVAQPKASDLKAYVGVVFISGDANLFFCESYNPTTSFPELSTIIVPTRETGRIVVTGDDMPPHTTVMCPKGYRDMNNENDGFSNP